MARVTPEVRQEIRERYQQNGAAAVQQYAQDLGKSESYIRKIATSRDEAHYKERQRPNTRRNG